MRRKSSLQRETATRDRILDAAVLRFSRSSYKETGLRDIAADVGVDVAYVHRCFGSKAHLFAQAVETAMVPAQRLTDAKNDLAGTLARHVCVRDVARTCGEVGPLDIMNRSLTSPGASRVLREFIQNDFINPLARTLNQPAATRAVLIAAFLTGLEIFKSVLAIESMLEAKGDEIEHLIAHVINEMMSTELVAERS